MTVIADSRPAHRITLSAFRLIALLEALSWIGLLVGMYFKYLATSTTETGVQIFGMVHGIVFVAFVAIAIPVGIICRWTLTTWGAGLLASIVPLCSVIFLIWVDRTGRLRPAERGIAPAAPAVTAPPSA